jgi:hypothetical protein
MYASARATDNDIRSEIAQLMKHRCSMMLGSYHGRARVEKAGFVRLEELREQNILTAFHASTTGLRVSRSRRS